MVHHITSCSRPGGRFRRRARPSWRRAELGARKSPVLVDAVELHVEVGAAIRVESVESRLVVRDPLAGLDRRVLGLQAPAHRFDDRVARQIQQVRLATTGRAGRAELVVELQPRTQNRRVADAAGDLVIEARGRRHAAEVAVRVERRAVDRAGDRGCRSTHGRGSHFFVGSGEPVAVLGRGFPSSAARSCGPRRSAG